MKKMLAAAILVSITLFLSAQTEYSFASKAISWKEDSITFFVYQLRVQLPDDTLSAPLDSTVKKIVSKYVYVKSDQWYACLPKNYIPFSNGTQDDVQKVMIITVITKEGIKKETSYLTNGLRGQIIPLTKITNKGEVHLFF